MTVLTKRLAAVSAGAVPSMMGLAIGLMALVFSATAAVATTRPIGRASAKREEALSP